LEDEIRRRSANVELLHQRFAHVLQPRNLVLDTPYLTSHHGRAAKTSFTDYFPYFRIKNPIKGKSPKFV
jgi:hypothetical protein